MVGSLALRIVLLSNPRKAVLEVVCHGASDAEYSADSIFMMPLTSVSRCRRSFAFAGAQVLAVIIQPCVDDLLSGMPPAGRGRLAGETGVFALVRPQRLRVEGG